MNLRSKDAVFNSGQLHMGLRNGRKYIWKSQLTVCMYIFLPLREITLQKKKKKPVLFLRHEEISSRGLKIPKVHKLFKVSPEQDSQK